MIILRHVPDFHGLNAYEAVISYFAENLLGYMGSLTNKKTVRQSLLFDEKLPTCNAEHNCFNGNEDDGEKKTCLSLLTYG